jgi:hypothetical protein
MSRLVHNINRAFPFDFFVVFFLLKYHFYVFLINANDKGKSLWSRDMPLIILRENFTLVP